MVEAYGNTNFPASGHCGSNCKFMMRRAKTNELADSAVFPYGCSGTFPLKSPAARTHKTDHSSHVIPPQFLLNGNIRIDFNSDETRSYGTQYMGWISLNPRKFSPEWFHRAAERNVELRRIQDATCLLVPAGSKNVDMER
jgi:hypothetical protein